MQLRKLNTAIKDGYQSVIDYWPDSPEAVAASYYIAKTYKEMGDIKLAKKAYTKTIADHGEDVVGVLARFDLADVARLEGDAKRQVALWQELVYNTPRTGAGGPTCVEASHLLASHFFAQGDFAAGLKSLATSHKPDGQASQVWALIRGPLATLAGTTETKPLANKMADSAAAWLRESMPVDASDDKQKAIVRSLTHYLADVYYNAGRTEEGLKAYDQLLDRLGSDDTTLSQKAAMQKLLNRRDDARLTYGRYQNQIEGQNQIAHSYREEHKPASAVPIYQDLITRDGANASRWQWQLGDSLREAGKYKDAIAAYRQTDRFPEDLKHMALCHRKMGEYKEALGLYRQVMSAGDASAPGALLEMARTYEEANQKESAIKAFQQVCKLFPKASEASIAHARLQDGYKINATLGGAINE